MGKERALLMLGPIVLIAAALMLATDSPSQLDRAVPLADLPPRDTTPPPVRPPTVEMPRPDPPPRPKPETEKIFIEERIAVASMGEDFCLHGLPADGVCELNLTALTWGCDFENKPGALITFGLSDIGGSITAITENPTNVVIDFTGPYPNSGGRVLLGGLAGQSTVFLERFGTGTAVGSCDPNSQAPTGRILRWEDRRSERDVPVIRSR